ncbi:DUF4351 domain-containing protein [Nostoc piscinale]|uniref:DUF4351 domain-containing protein n=1 Tax=Nostoc piscinale TaxID=224012 RepID=UPI0039A640AB
MFQQPIPSLLPFVPILRGGGEASVVQRALQILRADDQFNQLESLLAFFASFVLETPLVQQIMRWDMTVLRESPWYEEILTEGKVLGLQQGLERGLEQGLEQGARRQLIRVLQRRFGEVPPSVVASLESASVEQLENLMDAAITVSSLAEFMTFLSDESDTAQ